MPAVRAPTTLAVSVTSALSSTPEAVEYPLKSWSPVLVPDRFDADTAPKKVAAPAAVIKAFAPAVPIWKAQLFLFHHPQ